MNRTHGFLPIMWLSLIVGIGIAQGCAPPEEETQGPANECAASAVDCLWVKTLDPLFGTPLNRNQTYALRVTFDYRIVSYSAGTFSLYIADQDFAPLPGYTQSSVKVYSGIGTTSLSSSLTITSASVSRAEILIPLFGEGATMTTNVWHVNWYPVQ